MLYTNALHSLLLCLFVHLVYEDRAAWGAVVMEKHTRRLGLSGFSAVRRGNYAARHSNLSSGHHIASSHSLRRQTKEAWDFTRPKPGTKKDRPISGTYAAHSTVKEDCKIRDLRHLNVRSANYSSCSPSLHPCYLTVAESDKMKRRKTRRSSFWNILPLCRERPQLNLLLLEKSEPPDLPGRAGIPFGYQRAGYRPCGANSTVVEFSLW